MLKPVQVVQSPGSSPGSVINRGWNLELAGTIKNDLGVKAIHRDVLQADGFSAAELKKSTNIPKSRVRSLLATSHKVSISRDGWKFIFQSRPPKRKRAL